MPVVVTVPAVGLLQTSHLCIWSIHLSRLGYGQNLRLKFTNRSRSYTKKVKEILFVVWFVLHIMIIGNTM